MASPGYVSVTLKPKAFSDPRMVVLASILKVDVDSASWKMAKLWSICTGLQTDRPPLEYILGCLHPELGEEALVRSGLGERIDGVTRVRGCIGAIEWYGDVTDRQAAAGRARAAAAPRDEAGRMLPKGAKPRSKARADRPVDIQPAGARHLVAQPSQSSSHPAGSQPEASRLDQPDPARSQPQPAQVQDPEESAPVVEVDQIAASRSGASGSDVTADRATGARDAPIAKVLPFVARVPGDPHADERRRLLRVIGGEHVSAFNRLRVELASSVPPMGVMGDPAERALRALIERTVDLQGLEAKLRHVLAFREREARAIGKLKFFGATVWSEGPFGHASTRELDEAAAAIAPTGAAEPSANHGPARCVPFGEALDEANAIAAANGLLPKGHA